MNLENDLIGKYVEKLMKGQEDTQEPVKETINEDYLRKYGFI